MKHTTVPDVLDGVLDKETFEKARVYQIDKSNFGFWSNLYSQLESTVSERYVRMNNSFKNMVSGVRVRNFLNFSINF